MISPLVQSVGYALITKSVGSGYRVLDDLKAPHGIKGNTIGREATLLGLTTLFTTALQKIVTPVIKMSTKTMRNELLIRALFTAPALVIAEYVSRFFYPKHQWKKPEQPEQTFSNNANALNNPSNTHFDETFKNQFIPSMVTDHPQVKHKTPLLYNTAELKQKSKPTQNPFKIKPLNQSAIFMESFR